MANANSTVAPGIKVSVNTGTPIEDVVEYLKSCSDTFGQLAAIFKAISKEAEQYSQIKALANAGQYLAQDIENLADCWREEVNDRGVDNRRIGS